MKNNVIKNLFIAGIIAMGFATVSCTSNKVAVTDTMTSREIVQQAQNAYDNGNAKLAEQYYENRCSPAMEMTLQFMSKDVLSLPTFM